MKKVLAILLVLAALLSISACGKKKKIYFNEDEYKEALSEYYKEEEESSSKRVEDVSEAKEETEEELGVTKKDKQIVVKLTYDSMMQYEKIVFNKKGISEYRLTYMYFNGESKYEQVKELGDDGNDKLIKTDDKALCLVYKSKGIMQTDFESYLSLYERNDPSRCEILY